MGTFGENLKREREMRGVTLEEISNATKIGVRALQALEAEEFSKLPGGIFTRSFIRTYARYLGLDEESVMAEFQLISPREQTSELKRLGQQRPLSAEKSSRARLVGLLVAGGLLAGGFALYRYSRRALQPSTPASGAAPASNAEDASAPPARASSASEAQPAPLGAAPASEAAGLTPPRSIAVPQGLTLQVAATERAWVAVDADGQPSFQRVLNPNEIQALHAKNSFDIITGNAQGIILTLNGVTLEPLGHRGEVKKVHLTLDDVKNPHP